MVDEKGRDERESAGAQDRWLSVDQVAERLRLDAETVRQWFADGHLPADSCDADGQPRIRPADLETYLLEQR